MSTTAIISNGGDFPLAMSANASPAPSALATRHDFHYKTVARQLSTDLAASGIRAQLKEDHLSAKVQGLAEIVFKQDAEILVKDRTLREQDDKIKTLEKKISETLQEKSILEGQLRVQKIQNGELTLTNEALNHRLGQNEARRESLQNELDRVKNSIVLEQLVVEKNRLSLQLNAATYTRNGGAMLMVPIAGAAFISSGLIAAGVAAFVAAKTFTYVADTADSKNIFGSGTQDKRLRAVEVDKQISVIQTRIKPSESALVGDQQV